MLDLSRILKDKEHAIENPGDNETVCFMLQNSIAGGNASAAFVGKGIDYDGHLAWATLVIGCDGRGQRVPEAQRIREELDGLRLDTRSNGQMHDNKFKECVRRLQELKEVNSESAHIEKYLVHVTHPEYELLKETLKSTDNNSLENCYRKVSRKATEVSNSQLGKRDISKTPRNANVRFENPVELDAPNDVNIMDYVQDDGKINIPRHIFSQLHKSQLTQLSQHDRKRRSNRKHDRKRPKKKRDYQVKHKAMTLFEDFLQSSEDKASSDEDKDDKETPLNF